jgi:hypothetical protein
VRLFESPKTQAVVSLIPSQEKTTRFLDGFFLAGDEGFTTHQSNCFHNLLSGPSRRWSNMTNKAPTVRIPRRAKQFALRSTPKKNHPAMGGFSLAANPEQSSNRVRERCLKRLRPLALPAVQTKPIFCIIF